MSYFILPAQKQELLAYVDKLMYESTAYFAYKAFKARGLDTKTAWAAAKEQRDKRDR